MAQKRIPPSDQPHDESYWAPIGLLIALGLIALLIEICFR
jgi:hypothetical protein